MYTTYKFRGQDPVIGDLKSMFRNAEIKKAELHDLSNVSVSTIGNWWGGKTRKPQNATIEAVGRALGYQRKWVPYKNGNGHGR